MPEQLILVDENDQQIGTEEKLEAHKQGLLHRAFSIYIFNDKNELMLQQRALDKYHCGGLWTNTTCSHPRIGEDNLAAAHRRLQEEMGFDTELNKVTELIYKVDFENGLTEHEYLHVYIGRHNKDPKLTPEEANDFQWINLIELERRIDINPKLYSYWMQQTLPHIHKALETL
jgi:isopentenyl-diphosphate Delta-isomerase